MAGIFTRKMAEIINQKDDCYSQYGQVVVVLEGGWLEAGQQILLQPQASQLGVQAQLRGGNRADGVTSQLPEIYYC